MGGGLEVFEGLASFCEGEDAVDDGVDVVSFEGGDDAGVHAARADMDAVEMDGFGEDGEDVDTGSGFGEDADEVDVAAGGDGFEGEGEGASAAYFDDVVDAAFGGEGLDSHVPIGCGAVVDDFVGTEGAGSGKFFV